MSMSWWGMVFPNTGFTLATIDIGEALESEGVLWVASGMTIAQVTTWLMVAGLTIWGVYTRRLLWPEPEEKEAKEG